MFNPKAFLKTVCDSAVKKSPELLIAVGIAGFITTAVLAVKATPKAEQDICKAEEEKGESLTKIEKLKITYKRYIPAAIAATVSTVCVLASGKISAERNAELATAAAIAQATIRSYDDKIAEAVGEEKAAEVKQEVRKEVEQSPAIEKQVEKAVKEASKCQKSDEKMLPFIDGLSGRAFCASQSMIDKAVVIMNERLYNDDEIYVSVDDWYDALNDQGIKPTLTYTQLSGRLGWTADTKVMVDKSTWGDWDDGTPAHILGFATRHEPTIVMRC